MILREELRRSIQELERGRTRSELAALIRQCGASASLEEGRRVHEIVARDGSDRDTFVGNLLVQMYGQCGDLPRSREAFSGISSKNLFSWSILIAAHAQSGDLARAREIFEIMPATNNVAWNTMVSGYAQDGVLDSAMEFFREIPDRDVVSWNSMISGFVLSSHPALALFLAMDLDGIQPNRATFLSVLEAIDLEDLECLHGEITIWGWDSELVMGTALVRSYGARGLPGHARAAFDGISGRSVVTWNTLAEVYSTSATFDRMPYWDLVSWTVALVAYARDGHLQDAVGIFLGMPERSGVTWNAMLAGLVQLGAPGEGDWLFERMPARSLVSWTTMVFGRDHRRSMDRFRAMDLEGLQPNKIAFLSLIDGLDSPEALIDARIVRQLAACEGLDLDREIAASLVRAFGRCGSLADAELVLEKKNSSRDRESLWNAMVVAGAGSDAAFHFLRALDLDGLAVQRSSLIVALESCRSIAHGEALHRSVPGELDLAVGTAVISMYARLGDVAAALTAFDSLRERSLESWTAMISACALNGCANSAFHLFRAAGLDGYSPDSVTFIEVLVACSHAGLVSHGCEFFASFVGDFHLLPSVEHYNCLIDLLGRNGRLFDAYEVASSMPFEPNTVSWIILFGGSAVREHESRGAFGAAEERNEAGLLLAYIRYVIGC